MKKKFVGISILFLCLLFALPVSANENIEPFMQVVDTRAEYEQQKSAQETVDEIELSREKYSYNESEDGDTSKNYIKTKYDFNVGESEMTLDFKSFTIKFPSRRQF